MNEATIDDDQLAPPEKLAGLKLPKGWVIKEKRAKLPSETGGYFSIGYECVHEDGRVAFLKAIDLYTAIKKSGGNVLAVLQPLVAGAQAEKDLLDQCKTMDRVISTIDVGDIDELNGLKLEIPVPYIIFERADATARAVIFNENPPLHGWKLRTLHHVAVGLSQMHGRKIAHQDVKLSNILVFEDDELAKVSDLGRSVQQGRSVPHDQMEWPGANSYAPPEFAYGYVSPDFNVRRLAADLYMLGSAACAIFTGSPINPLLYEKLASEFHPIWIGGTYAGNYADVLPYLEQAFSEVISELRNLAIPQDVPYRDSLISMLRQWCDPNPANRGHPRTRAIAGTNGNRYTLERYLSELDILAHKASMFDRAQKT